MDALNLDLNVNTNQAVSSINDFFSIYEKGVQGMAGDLEAALNKKYEIAIKFKMDGAKIVADATEKIDKDVQGILDTAKIMNNEWGKTPNELKRQLSILKQIQGDTAKFAKDGKGISQEWKSITDLIGKAQSKLQQFEIPKMDMLPQIQKTLADIEQKWSNINKPQGDGLEKTLINSAISADLLVNAFKMLVSAIGDFIDRGIRMETLFMQLQGFTGSVENATDAYREFVRIGQSTAFDAAQVGTAARTMMGFGIETKSATNQVKRLAIMASATGSDLNHMSRNLGQVMANQKAYTRDLMQFANQGIPIYQKLAEIFEVSTEEIRGMVEEGQIGFPAVSQAIRELTKEGTNFAETAKLMDNTWTAKIESINGAIDGLAGNIMALITAADQTIGGFLSGVLQGVIDFVNYISDGLADLRGRLQPMAPLIAAIAAAIAAMALIGVVTLIGQIAAAMPTLLAALSSWALSQWAVNAALAVGQALIGNWGAIVAAAGAAFGIYAIAAMNGANATGDLNDATKENIDLTNATIEEREAAAFATDGLTNATKDLIKAQKDEYDSLREQQNLAKQKAQSAIEWARAEVKAVKEAQKEMRQDIKNRYQDEKIRHKEVNDQIKLDYKERKRLIDEEFDAKIRALDAELGLLDKKSAAEIKLEQIERRRLELKLKSLKPGSEEWLQTKVRLEQMDKQVKREELIQKKKEAQLEKTKKLQAAEADKDQAIAAEKKLHDGKMDAIKAEEEKLDQQLKRAQERVDEMQNRYDTYFNELARARFDDHEDAMAYMDREIKKWGDLETKALQVLANIERAKKKEEGSTTKAGRAADNASDSIGWFNLGGLLASGGPAKGGTDYIVNELGQEAFLSASGHLSKIKAPSWGRWRAPSNGTVIPAHLASQLDIPAGGVNINRMPSMSRTSASNYAPVSGDNITNTVTVQSNNPGKTASDMLVSLTKIRRRRLR